MSCPLLFLIFNRPEVTERVFSRIREYRPANLYIAADGPRPAKEGEIARCEQTRKFTENIDWPCQVQRLYREENLGCKVAVSSAIDWFFEHETEGIILEDDCLPDLSFFRFCEEMLLTYRETERIGMISGYSFQSRNTIYEPDTSYYYSKYPMIWGWATWRRVWRHYDVSLAEWNGTTESLMRDFPNTLVRRQIKIWLDNVKSGKVDTWDYQLFHTLISNRQLSVSPCVNLVQNVGFGPDATHTGGKGDHLPMSSSMEFPLRSPLVLEHAQIADRYMETHVHGIASNYITLLIKGFISFMLKIIYQSKIIRKIYFFIKNK